MGRPDKQTRHTARACDQVRSLIARARFADAANVLLSLPSTERDFALAPLAAGMERELEQAREQGDQARLIAWLARTEREPRLLDQLGQHALRTRFALFAGALRARMWPRAQRLWGGLRAALSQHELFTAIDAVVSTCGDPPPEVLAQLFEDARRMGYDDAPLPRVAHDEPRSVEEVEARCMRCFASESWPRFRDITTSWLHSVSPEVALPLRLLSAALSERELLVRSRANSPGVLEVAAQIATLAADSGAPAELEPQVALCLRVVSRVLLAGPAIAKVSAFDALAVFATTALRYPALRSALSALLRACALDRAQPRTRLELLRIGYVADPSPAGLVAVVVKLRSGECDVPASIDAPSWFVAAFTTALDTPAALASALEAAVLRVDDPLAVELCQALFEVLPVELAVATVERLWDHASESLRTRLAAASESLLTRMIAPPEQSADSTLERFLARVLEHSPELGRLSKSEIRHVMNTPLGQDLLEELQLASIELKLAPSMEPLAQRLFSRVAAYDLDALSFAASIAPTRRDAVRLVDAHLARLPTLEARFRSLARAATADHAFDVSELIEARCVENIEVRATDAARGGDRRGNGKRTAVHAHAVCAMSHRRGGN